MSNWLDNDSPSDDTTDEGSKHNDTTEQGVAAQLLDVALDHWKKIVVGLGLIIGVPVGNHIIQDVRQSHARQSAAQSAVNDLGGAMKHSEKLLDELEKILASDSVEFIAKKVGACSSLSGLVELCEKHPLLPELEVTFNSTTVKLKSKPLDASFASAVQHMENARKSIMTLLDHHDQSANQYAERMKRIFDESRVLMDQMYAVDAEVIARQRALYPSVLRRAGELMQQEQHNAGTKMPRGT